MRRREFVAALGVGTLAGCVGSGGGGSAPDDTDSPTGTPEATPTETDTDASTETGTESPTETETATETDTPTESDTPTETPTPTRITGQSLRPRGDCSEGSSGTASVSFADGRITVEGCIRGRYGCSRPKLRSVSYDEAGDRVTVTVETVKAEDADVCTQQIVYRAYGVDVTYDGPTPGTVAVAHADGDETEVVATASP